MELAERSTKSNKKKETILRYTVSIFKCFGQSKYKSVRICKIFRTIMCNTSTIRCGTFNEITVLNFPFFKTICDGLTVMQCDESYCE